MVDTKRNVAIDALKGLAIISVALYHFGGGYLTYGYLGVDIFFVVGGYLLIGSLKRQIEKGEFNYWKFLFRKIIRLWPLVIVASLVAVGIGFLLMLPDDYENLAESAIASSVFANNILQCITTRNYWDVVNLYKPLMHLWYISVLMQAYVILPIILFVFHKINNKNGIAIGTLVITLISLTIYLIPTFSDAWKFYYLPFRLFELTAGGFLVFWNPKWQGKSATRWISYAVLLLLLCSRTEIASGSVMLLSTVILSFLLIWATKEQSFSAIENSIIGVGAVIGKRSYSIYIWHQLIVAFLFYSFFPKQNVLSLIVFIGLTTLISLVSYRFIEIPLGSVIGKKKREVVVVVSTFAVAMSVCGVSFFVYRHAGVVRDVPELNIFMNNVHHGMHAEYCDRPYSWDGEFGDDGRVKVLTIGNSFGRDWANILYEWDTKGDLDISYLYYTENAVISHVNRVSAADIIFFVMGPGYGEMPEIIKETIDSHKLYVVGNKNYGESNGIIYAHRLSNDYFDQTVEIPDELIVANSRDKLEFLDHYIDMMAPVKVENTRIKVFTDNNKYISQDCRHLTQAGAQFYARTLYLEEILADNR